jgi:chloramphenicol 3-O phosphotransferase
VTGGPPGPYPGAVMTQMIVLNGGSSSGKSGLARCLQAVLPDPWLVLGCDTLVQALPASLRDSDAGFEVAPDGSVGVGVGFRTLEAAWIEGVVAMARAGARVIVDEVFLGGAASQQRWLTSLAELRPQVLWVSVRCDSAVAAGRETARGDRDGRVPGRAGPPGGGVRPGGGHHPHRVPGVRPHDRSGAPEPRVTRGHPRCPARKNQSAQSIDIS